MWETAEPFIERMDPLRARAGGLLRRPDHRACPGLQEDPRPDQPARRILSAARRRAAATAAARHCGDRAEELVGLCARGSDRGGARGGHYAGFLRGNGDAENVDPARACRADRRSCASMIPAVRRRPRRPVMQQLVDLFADWRAFNHPRIVHGKPDYSAAAMAAKARALPAFQRRLAAIDTSGWSASRSRRLPARRSRDERARFLPSGAQALGARSRLLPDRLRRDERRSGARRPVGRAQYRPPQLHLSALAGRRCAADGVDRRRPRAACRCEGQSRRAARRTTFGHTAIAPSTSRPRCWPSSKPGTLVLNDLGGKRPASLQGASPELRAAVANARAATEQFAAVDPRRGAAANGPVRRRQGQLQLVSQARPAEPATTSTSSRSCSSVSSTARWRRFGWRKCATARCRRSPRSATRPPIAEWRDAAHREALPAAGRCRLHHRPTLLPSGPARPDRRLYPARRAQFFHQRDRARPAAAVEPPDPLDRARAPSPRAAPEPDPRHAAVVQHLRRPIRRLRDGDGGSGDAGRALRRHSARPGAGVDHARQPRRARPRLAPRPGERDRSRRSRQVPRRLDAARMVRRRRAASSASSSCSTCASPATGRAISSARWSSIICSRSPRTAPNSRSARIDNRATFAAILASGIVPPTIIEDEMAEAPAGALSEGHGASAPDRRRRDRGVQVAGARAAAQESRARGHVRADQGRRAFRHRDEPRHAGREPGPHLPVGAQGRGRDRPYPAVARRRFRAGLPGDRGSARQDGRRHRRRPRDDPAARDRQAGGGRPGDERPHVASRRDRGATSSSWSTTA